MSFKDKILTNLINIAPMIVNINNNIMVWKKGLEKKKMYLLTHNFVRNEMACNNSWTIYFIKKKNCSSIQTYYTVKK